MSFARCSIQIECSCQHRRMHQLVADKGGASAGGRKRVMVALVEQASRAGGEAARWAWFEPRGP